MLGAAPALCAQQPAPVEKRFSKSETMIAMRDGVKLYTTLLRPEGREGAVAVHPAAHALRDRRERAEARLRSYLKDLADEGYIFVFQDIRGRFKSEGKFVMTRPPRDKQDPKAIDEGTDTYDTIDWLLKNVPDNNGRVGMLGISYAGWLTVMAMLDPHPALKAVSPQASPADMFLGDDFHHNGAFRLSYGFEYVAMMETDKVNTNFKFDRHDTFEWYLKLGALSNVNAKHFHGKMPTWNDFVAHPNYDAFWKKQAFEPYLTRVTVPTLNVAGWFDQEDFYGPLKIYELLEKHDKKNQNFLVVGPWNHGGWASGPGDRLGQDRLRQRHRQALPREGAGAVVRLSPQGQGQAASSPRRLMFQTGANKWVAHDRWPPQRRPSKQAVLSRRTASWRFDAAASEADGTRSTLTSPTRPSPVPYRPRPVTPTYPGREWQVWMVEDQRFTHHRPDVLSYETEPLEEDVVVAGSADRPSVRRDDRHRLRLDRAAHRRLSRGLRRRTRAWAAISC